jgi:pimeloyl-ACP methyl ester carboxylesterase
MNLKPLRQIPLYAALALMLVVPVQASPKWPLPDGIKSIEVNGYDMAYQEMGSGFPLVLVHGAMSDYRTWSGPLPVFARKYRVIAVSLRHYFPEKWNGAGDDFSIEQHIDDVPEFIKRMNLGKVHLLGHSRGGAVSLNVAKRHPELIKTLILEDASGLEALLPESPDDQRLATEALANGEALAKALAAGEIDRGVQVWFDSLAGSGAWSRLAPGRKQNILDNLGTALKPEGRPVTTCNEIARLDFPVLLLNGERSPRRYPAMFAAMRKCKEMAAPIVIPNAAHGMHRDNPTAFETAVLDFLSRH